MSATLLAVTETTAVRIPIAGHRWIDASVTAPAAAAGVVIFADSGGHDRIAEELNDHGLATVMADLLAPGERADVPVLTERVVDVIDWTQTSGTLAGLPLALFGAGTGAAAALDAAAERPREVRAVVCRSGRPDLAASLEDVEAPTLLIAGADDDAIVAINEQAVRRMTATAVVEIVPPESVAALAARWFMKAHSSKSALVVENEIHAGPPPDRTILRKRGLRKRPAAI